MRPLVFLSDRWRFFYTPCAAKAYTCGMYSSCLLHVLGKCTTVYFSHNPQQTLMVQCSMIQNETTKHKAVDSEARSQGPQLKSNSRIGTQPWGLPLGWLSLRPRVPSRWHPAALLGPCSRICLSDCTWLLQQKPQLGERELEAGDSRALGVTKLLDS